MPFNKKIIIYTVSESLFVAPVIKHVLRSNCQIEKVYITTNSTNTSLFKLIITYLSLLRSLSFRDILKGGYYYLFNKFFAPRRLEKILTCNDIKFSYLNDINDPKHLTEVNNSDAQACIFFAFNQIAKQNFINNLKHHCLNLHLGYLPNYRGKNSIFFAMANNEHQSGVTLHEVEEKIDSGKIISRSVINLIYDNWYENMQSSFTAAATIIVDYYYGKTKIENVKTPSDRNKSYFSTPKPGDVKNLYKNGKNFF
jgi:hypothetical protein